MCRINEGGDKDDSENKGRSWGGGGADTRRKGLKENSMYHLQSDCISATSPGFYCQLPAPLTATAADATVSGPAMRGDMTTGPAPPTTATRAASAAAGAGEEAAATAASSKWPLLSVKVGST
jgi:hypothetical protein